jgi:hypothetical protein
MVILFGVVDDDGKEDHGAADDAIGKGIGKLVQPGFFVQGGIGSYQGVKDEPGDGYGAGDHPEAAVKIDPAPDEQGFGQEYFSAEMEYDGGQQCGDVVADDVPKDRDSMWLFVGRHAGVRY